MIPDLIRPSPSAHQAGANMVPEGAVTMVDDAQSRASGYCSAIAPSVVVVRIRLRLRVGVGVKCLSRNVDSGGLLTPFFGHMSRKVILMKRRWPI